MPPSNITQLVWWEYLTGERLNMDGTTIPASFSALAPGMIVAVEAVGGDLRYAINFPTANVHSPGVVPQDGARIIGPLSNWESLVFWGAAGAIAHVTYYKENVRG